MVERKPQKRVLIIITVSLLTILILCTFISKTVYYASLPLVSITKPERASLPITWNSIGNIQYKNKQVESYELPVTVQKIHVKSGDEVKKGATLIEIDSPEIFMERKRLELAVLQLENRLAQGGNDARQIKEIKLQLEIAKDGLNAYLLKYPTDGKVYAQFDGIVTLVNARENTLIGAGTSLIEVTDPSSEALLTWRVPLNESKKFQLNDDVQIHYTQTELDNTQSDATDSLKIARIETDITANEALFFASLSSAKTWEEQQCSIAMIHSSSTYDLVVPLSAIRKDLTNNTFYVLVLRERDGLFGKENYVEKVSINKIYENNLNAAISSNSIFATDQVIVASTSSVQSGQTVKVKTNAV